MPPNVLLLMCDQLRFDFLGYAGASFAQTPTIDRLARQGTTFARCYTNSAICAPARVALASGQLPHRMGALDNSVSLPLSAQTYYRQLRDHGYAVGCVGKLDLAKTNLDCGHGDLPRTYAWGFTHPMECMGRMDSLQVRDHDPARRIDYARDLAPEVMAGYADGLPRPKDPYTYWLEQQGLLDLYFKDMLLCRGMNWLDRHIHDSLLPTEAYEDMFIGNRAVEWLDRIETRQPWHLFVSFVGPHDPFTPPREYADRFRDTNVPPPVADDLSGKPVWIQKRATGPAMRHNSETPTLARRQYLACMHAIDTAISRIVTCLDARGMSENTVILFCADHGEMLHDHGLITKHCAYEASAHIPLFATGPGIEAGKSAAAVTELIDVAATICDLAKCPMAGIDGRSFAPLFRDAGAPHRDVAVCMETPYRAIMDDRYKYIENVNDRHEFYDLRSDPLELDNRITEAGDEVRRLRRRLAERLL
jgi:arylsulfatase